MSLFYSFTEHEADVTKLIEDFAIEGVQFLQLLYLIYIFSIFTTLIRCIFYDEERSVKIPISFKTTDGTYRHILQLDTQLLKATDLATTFIMFYMVPPWISCFVYFVTFKICLRSALLIFGSKTMSLKPKHE